MKISKVRGSKVQNANVKENKVKSNDEEFANQLKGASSKEETAPVQENIAVGPVGSVLAIQESPDAFEALSRASHKDYGKELLDRLDQLRIGILDGIFSKDRLAELAHKLRERQKESDDPKLNVIIKEIELRAEVELAKLTRNK